LSELGWQVIQKFEARTWNHASGRRGAEERQRKYEENRRVL